MIIKERNPAEHTETDNFSVAGAKAEDIAVHQFGLGKTISTGWRVFCENARSIVLVFLLVYIPINIGLSFVSLDYLMEEYGLRVLRMYVKIVSLTEFFVGVLATMSLATLVEASLLGKPITWYQAMRRAFSRWCASIGTGFLAGLIILGMTLLLIVPGVIWTLYYHFVVYVVVLRGLSGKAALNYSKRLVQGQWWRVMGYLTVIALIDLAVAAIVIVPSMFTPDVAILDVISDTLGDLLSAPCLCMVAVFFLNSDYLKMRDDEQHAAAAQGATGKKARIWVPALFAAGLVCVVAFFAIAGRDIQEPNVDDLIVDLREPSAEDNAYTYLEQATNTFYWPDDSDPVVDYLKGEDVDDRVLVEVLENNKKMLVAVERAQACDRCVTPEVTGFDTLLPYISQWRNMGRVMALKTRRERLAGRYAEATDTCVSLLRFGDIVQADAGCILNYLVGMAVMELGLTEARDLVQDKDLPKAELEKLSKGLADLGSFVPGLEQAIKVEHKVVVDTIDRFENGEYGLDDLSYMSAEEGRPGFLTKRRRMPAYLFKPNATKLIFADSFRRMIADARLVYADMEFEAISREIIVRRQHPLAMIRPNVVGSIIYSMMMPSIEGILERKCRLECGVRATHVLASIALYRSSKGELPEDLNSLVPEYLEAVPMDPYDGEPLRYSRDRGIIYSVGRDLIDSGGSSKCPDYVSDWPAWKRRWKAEDAVFEIEKSKEVDTELPEL